MSFRIPNMFGAHGLAAKLDLRFAGRATLVQQKWAKPGHMHRPD
jgi:hypothetical protein